MHFTQEAAVEHATALLNAKLGGSTAAASATRSPSGSAASGSAPASARRSRSCCAAGSASTTPGCCRATAAWSSSSPRHGLLQVICGTDTLGVGINVPIRTVLFTGLAKFDGNRQRVLRIREFPQIAGRAGRAGFDTAGYVVVQAPEHAIENERAKAKADAKNAAMSAEKQAKRKSKAQLRKPPEGAVVWTEQTFDKLVAGRARAAGQSRMKVDNAMLINVLGPRGGRLPGAAPAAHRQPRGPRATSVRLARRALRLARSLRAAPAR